MDFETVIGLEVHVELLTATKLFCGCLNKFGAEPNSLVCPVCLGMPGVLPVINREAVRKHALAALALECSIAEYSKYDRKNYFYPDMPKNYQISQYDMPLALGGILEIENDKKEKKTIHITRIHLEEDTGKSIHAGEAKSISDSDYTLLDYNRAGVPLLEIVSEPEMNSPLEAYNYLTALRKILTWTGVSDCRMEQGSLRCDANISLRIPGAGELGTKVEIKNMNSFRSVRAALEFEVGRQSELLEKKENIAMETRGWEEDRQISISMRSKEEAHDYRYFPEPDLTPVRVDSVWIDEIREQIPEMPEPMAERFVRQYGIPEYDAGILTAYRGFAEFFEEACVHCNDAKQVSNWMMGDISKYLNSKSMEIGQTNLSPRALGAMIEMIRDETISGKIGKDLIGILLEKGGEPSEIVEKNRWELMTSADELLPLIKQAMDRDPKLVEQYLQGREKAAQFFIGQVMKASKGKAGPGQLNKLLVEELEKRRE